MSLNQTRAKSYSDKEHCSSHRDFVRQVVTVAQKYRTTIEQMCRHSPLEHLPPAANYQSQDQNKMHGTERHTNNFKVDGHITKIRHLKELLLRF